MALIVLEKLVRRPIQRPSLMGANVEPDPRATIVSSRDQKASLAANLGLKLDKLAFDQCF